MKRCDFISSISSLICNPHVIPTLITQERINKSGELRSKSGYWFRITDEMKNDKSYTEDLFSNVESFIWRGCKENGINLRKPFTFTLCYSGDDFVRNKLTGIITQTKKVEGIKTFEK